MKVFVAGATGVAGRRACRVLVDAGHEVTALARTAEKVELLKGLGAKPVNVDLFDASALKEAASGSEAVVNLATKIPTSLARMGMRSAWKENDRIRTEASHNLAEAARAVGAVHFIQESIAFAYEDRGDDWIDEEVPLDTSAHLNSLQVAEQNARDFGNSDGSGIVLRFGQFYAPDATHTVTMVKTARRGFSPFIGSPEAYAPMIHADDVARAVGAALSAPSGTYNVTDDEPLQRGDLTKLLAHAVGKKSLRAPPAVTMKMSPVSRSLLRSQRVSNRRFRDATGWSPSVASARAGLPEVVAEILAGREGFERVGGDHD